MVAEGDAFQRALDEETHKALLEAWDHELDKMFPPDKEWKGLQAFQRTFDGAEVVHDVVAEADKKARVAAVEALRAKTPAFRVRRKRVKRQTEALFDRGEYDVKKKDPT